MKSARLSALLATFAIVLAWTPAAARAQTTGRAAAKVHYERGTTEYNLGHFDEAIKAFESAYEMDRAPILLFNIAQAHRQMGNIERATFFYRRYLDSAPKDARNRSDVEKRVKDLEDLVKQQNEVKKKPPTSVGTDREAESSAPSAEAPPPGGAGRPATSPAGQSLAPAPNDATDASTPPALAAAPRVQPSDERRIRLGLDLGPTVATFSGANLGSPVILGVRAFGGYAFTVGQGAIDVGLALSLSPLHYQRTDTSAESLSTLFGVLARAGGRYPIALGGSLHLIADLGVGVLWWGGLGEKNPFTEEGIAATGSIAMPSVRVAAGLQYDLPEHFFVYLLPAYSFAKTTSGLENVVSRVGLFDIPLGVGRTF